MVLRVTRIMGFLYVKFELAAYFHYGLTDLGSGTEVTNRRTTTAINVLWGGIK